MVGSEEEQLWSTEVEEGWWGIPKDNIICFPSRLYAPLSAGNDRKLVLNVSSGVQRRRLKLLQGFAVCTAASPPRHSSVCVFGSLNQGYGGIRRRSRCEGWASRDFLSERCLQSALCRLGSDVSAFSEFGLGPFYQPSWSWITHVFATEITVLCQREIPKMALKSELNPSETN